MTYSIVQPPFTLQFREMSKKDLEAYRAWFHQVMPERLAELSREVQRTPGFEGWKQDFSPESLEVLGRWFEGQVETRQQTPGELGELMSKLIFPIDLPEEELTNRTFSLAMDIGMYFSQVVLKNLRGTVWDQPLKNKKFADYGQPVLIGFGPVPLNPFRIMVMLAYGIARKQQSGSGLRKLYETWAKMRS